MIDGQFDMVWVSGESLSVCEVGGWRRRRGIGRELGASGSRSQGVTGKQVQGVTGGSSQSLSSLSLATRPTGQLARISLTRRPRVGRHALPRRSQ